MTEHRTYPAQVARDLHLILPNDTAWWDTMTYYAKNTAYKDTLAAATAFCEEILSPIFDDAWTVRPMDERERIGLSWLIPAESIRSIIAQSLPTGTEWWVKDAVQEMMDEILDIE